MSEVSLKDSMLAEMKSSMNSDMKSAMADEMRSAMKSDMRAEMGLEAEAEQLDPLGNPLPQMRAVGMSGQDTVAEWGRDIKKFGKAFSLWSPTASVADFLGGDTNTEIVTNPETGELMHAQVPEPTRRERMIANDIDPDGTMSTVARIMSEVVDPATLPLMAIRGPMALQGALAPMVRGGAAPAAVAGKAMGKALVGGTQAGAVVGAQTAVEQLGDTGDINDVGEVLTNTALGFGFGSVLSAGLDANNVRRTLNSVNREAAEDVTLSVAALTRDKIAQGIDVPTAFKEAATELDVGGRFTPSTARTAARRASRLVKDNDTEAAKLIKVISEDLGLLGSPTGRIARGLANSNVVQAPVRLVVNSKPAKFASELAVPLSTRTGQLSKKVQTLFRNHEMDVHIQTGRATQATSPWMNSMKSLRKQNPQAAKRIDTELRLAQANGGYGRAMLAMSENGIPAASFKPVQDVLDGIRLGLDEVGHSTLDKGMFFPSHVEDLKGLRAHMGQEQEGVLSSALDTALAAKRKAGSLAALTPAEVSQVFNQVLYQKGGSALRKSRTIDEVDIDMMKYYANAEDSLGDYLGNAIGDIASRKFNGHGVGSKRVAGPMAQALDEARGRLSVAEHDELLDLVRVRTQGASMPQGTKSQLIKNISYMATVTDPVNAMVQVADMPLAAYKHGTASTLKGIMQAIQAGDGAKIAQDLMHKYPQFSEQIMQALGKGGSRRDMMRVVGGLPIEAAEKTALITKLSKVQDDVANTMDIADFGLVDHIAAEMTRGKGAVAKATDTLFKVSGFSKLDRFGKRVHLNASVNKLKKMSEYQMQRKYGTGYSDIIPQARIDLANGNLDSDAVRQLVWNDLLDMQPISMSELPEAYLAHPELRFLYALKSFGLKQMDILRRDFVDEIAAGEVGDGVKNLARLGIAVTAGMGSYRAGKDAMYGNEMGTAGEYTAEALLSLMLMSGYTAEMMGSGDVKGTVGTFVAPVPLQLLQAGVTSGMRLADGDPDWYQNVGRMVPFIKNPVKMMENQ